MTSAHTFSKPVAWVQSWHTQYLVLVVCVLPLLLVLLLVLVVTVFPVLLWHPVPRFPASQGRAQAWGTALATALLLAAALQPGGEGGGRRCDGAGLFGEVERRSEGGLPGEAATMESSAFLHALSAELAEFTKKGMCCQTDGWGPEQGEWYMSHSGSSWTCHKAGLADSGSQKGLRLSKEA